MNVLDNLAKKLRTIDTYFSNKLHGIVSRIVMLRTVFLLFSILFPLILIGQKYSIIDVDASKFPLITADLSAQIPKGTRIDIDTSNVKIIENNSIISPLELSPPKSSVIPLSIVLVLDNSASMRGFRFEMLKQTAKAFITKLPLEITDVAIASFNTEINILSDYTHNIRTLNTAIDKIKADGGTNYDAAFLSDFFGAINIASHGKNKAIIIFITDGLCETQVDNITEKAIKSNVEINCITIGFPISDELKDIANLSGGSYYSELNNGYDIERAYETIYKIEQKNTYGKISWMSKHSCDPNKTAQIHINKQIITLDFKIPPDKVGNIELSHSNIRFKSTNNQNKTLFIKGNNTALHIPDIISSNPNIFSVSASEFPVQALPDKWHPLTFNYHPIDTFYNTGTYKILNSHCPDLIIEASNSGKKKIQLVNPTAKNIYAVHDTINVIWKGIDNNTAVDLYYQVEHQNHWKNIGQGSHFRHTFQAPAVAHKIRIKALVTNDLNIKNIVNNEPLIISAHPIKSVQMSSEANEVLLTNSAGEIQSWNLNTSRKKLQFEKPAKTLTGYHRELNRVISFNQWGMDIFTNRNGLFIKTIPFRNKKTYATITYINNRECYTTALKFSGNLWDPSQNITISGIPSSGILDAACASNGALFVIRKKDRFTVYKANPIEKIHTIKCSNETGILNLSGEYFAVFSDSTTQWYDNNQGKLVTSLFNEKFVQFHKSGKYLLSKTATHYNLYNLASGIQMQSIAKENAFQISEKGKYLLFEETNTASITNLENNKLLFSSNYKHIKNFNFSPSENKFFIQTADSLFVFNILTTITELAIGCDSASIKHISFANDNQLLVATEYMVSLWNIESKLDADTSAYFNIIRPEPTVADEIRFPETFINQSKERILTQAINNNTNYNIIIDSIKIESENTTFECISKTKKIAILPNESAWIEVRFTPIDTLSYKGNLLVFSTGKKYQISLSGKGKSMGYELTTPLCNFEDLNYGETSDTVLALLKNTGSETLYIREVSLADAANNYKLWSYAPNKVLEANQVFNANIAFTPISRGLKTAKIKIALQDSPAINATQLVGRCRAKSQVIVEVSTYNSKSKQALSSEIEITNLYSAIQIEKGFSNSDGKFYTTLNTDLNYIITANLQGFISDSENIDLTDPQLNDTLDIRIALTPIIKDAQFRLNNVFFETASADLLSISQTELNRLVNFMIANSTKKVVIQGHTDAIGSSESNLILSNKRAISVKNYLIKNNINANRITIEFYGEQKPIADNETKAGRKANRRVEVRLIN